MNSKQRDTESRMCNNIQYEVQALLLFTIADNDSYLFREDIDGISQKQGYVRQRAFQNFVMSESFQLNPNTI